MSSIGRVDDETLLTLREEVERGDLSTDPIHDHGEVAMDWGRKRYFCIRCGREGSGPQAFRGGPCRRREVER